MNWSVRIAQTVLDDFRQIVAWTAEHFGDRQAAAYAQTLMDAIGELHAGPQQAGVRQRDDNQAGIHTLHVAHRGRPGRHFVMFRIAAQETQTIDVLRLLHDAMDLARHVPPMQ